MTTLASLDVRVRTDATEFARGIADTQQRLQTFGRNAAQVGRSWSRNVTLPMIGAGIALGKVATDFEGATHTIRRETGATGAELEALGQDMRAVFREVPVDIGQVAEAIAELNTRTGASGEPLQHMARQVLELSRMTGENLNGVIRSSTRLFGDWDVATEEQGHTLDFLFRTSQATGAGIAQLADQVVKFGGPLRQMGFGLEEALILLGRFEQEGVNSELVLGSLRIALGNLAREGVEEPAEAFRVLIDRIREAETAGEATAMAMETFGARAGPDMAAAIREGRFEIEELLDQVRASEETINGVADATRTFSERLRELSNRALEAADPLGTELMEAAEGIFPLLERGADAVAGMVRWFTDLEPAVQRNIGVFAGILAAVGPLLKLLRPLAFVAGIVLKPAFLALAASVAAVWLPIRRARQLFRQYEAEVVPLVRRMVEAVGRWMEQFGPMIEGVRERVGHAIGSFQEMGRRISAIVAALVAAIREQLLGQLGRIVDGVRDRVDRVTGFFRDMYERVVGGSIVPDMIREIGEHFARLDAGMVDPVDAATNRVSRGFRDMLRSVTSSSRSLGDVVAQMVDGILRDLQLLERNRLFSTLAGGVLGLLEGGGEGVPVNPAAGLRPIQHAASGGVVMAGDARWVGEHGVELFLPQAPGRIVRNEDLTAAATRAGGPHYEIHMQPTVVVHPPDPPSFLAWLRRNRGAIAEEMWGGLQEAGIVR